MQVVIQVYFTLDVVIYIMSFILSVIRKWKGNIHIKHTIIFQASMGLYEVIYHIHYIYSSEYSQSIYDAFPTNLSLLYVSQCATFCLSVFRGAPARETLRVAIGDALWWRWPRLLCWSHTAPGLAPQTPSNALDAKSKSHLQKMRYDKR